MTTVNRRTVASPPRRRRRTNDLLGATVEIVTPDPDDPTFHKWMIDLRQLEKQIHQADIDGLRARWRSGRILLERRGDAKRLPNGDREIIMFELEVSTTEINNRMKLAEKYQVEELSNVLDSFLTWRNICRHGLHEKQAAKPLAGKSLVPAVTTFKRKVTSYGPLTKSDRKAITALIDALTELLEGGVR